MGAWDNLSIREKADMMKAAIRNGITTLPEIKQAYNEFAEGGNIYDGTKPHSSQMQKKYIYDVLPGLFAQDGVKISVTSGYRPGAVVRGTNKPSRHGLKQAADIVGDFDAIRRVLDDPNSNTSKWLLANGYGYLDETSKTGTTKFWHDKKRDHSHYHIGTDSGIVSSYAKKMQKLLSELPQQQETVSMLPTAVTVPEFIPYNPQAFFGQQAATVQMPIESADVPQEQVNTVQRPTEQNNNFGTFSTIMGLLNAATPQESIPVIAQQAKASSPYIVNRFDKGGSKKSGGSFYQTHRARWFNFLRKKGVDPVKAERLASYFSAQDALESGYGTSSAARQKNNYGGMQRLDKKTNKMVNVSYGSINDYMNAKWKMMNSKYSRALNAKSIQEYANILNDPKYHGKGYMYGLYEGYRDGQPLDVARQTKYMNDYTRIMMDIAGEKGFKGADVLDDLSIVQPENPYTQFIPFEPFNPQVFNNPQAFVAPTREQFEVEQPIVEAAKDYAYSPEQLEKEERRQGLNNLSFILGMMNGGNGNSFADTIGMLTGNIAAEGGKIHIKPENRGKFTALKKRTGHSATWFKEHGTPAQKKMATFALNARHWKHGLGGNLYLFGGDDDNNPRPVTTGGAGYIPPVVDDPVAQTRKYLYTHILPISDYNIKETINGALEGEFEYRKRNEPKFDYEKEYPKNTDYTTIGGTKAPLSVIDGIWADYLQIPQKDRKKFVGPTIQQSKYKPSSGGRSDINYYSLPLTGGAKSLLVKEGMGLPIGKNKVTDTLEKYGNTVFNLGDHTIGRGKDNKGDYISYYDVFDLNPFSDKYNGTDIPLLNKLNDASFGIGKPVHIYDRIYLDDYYGVPSPYRGGIYLPEVTITGKKRRKGRKHGYGGHIYDGTSEDTQQMNTPRYRKLLDAEIKEELSDNDVMELPLAAELSDVRVTGKKKRNVFSQIEEKWIKNDKGEEVPTYWGYNPDTKQKEQLYRLEDGKSADESVFFTPDGGWSYNVPQAAEMRKAHEQWVKNGGNASDFDKVILGYLGFGLTPIALPEAATGIWAASQTPAGQTLLAGTLGGEAWEALNHGITGQSWGDNLGDVIGLDKDNYLGRTALGLANPFYGLSPNTVYKGGAAATELGKSLLNAGKEGVQYAAKVADNTARYVSPSYDLYRTIGETPVSRGSLQKSLTEDFGIFEGPKRVTFFDTPYRQRIEGSNIIKEPAILPEQYGWRLGDYGQPEVLGKDGRWHLNPRKVKGKFRDPIDHSIWAGRESVYQPEDYLFHYDVGNYPVYYDANGNPMLSRVPDVTGDLGPIWWNKNSQWDIYNTENIHPRVIRVPDYGNYRQAASYYQKGDSNAILTGDYPLGDAEFLERDNLVGTMRRGIFAQQPTPKPLETPTIEWADAAKTPQITAENAASITPEQWTAAQDAAIARGDMAEAQRLRDLHAKGKGYNSSLPLYHGSPDENITVFDPYFKPGTWEGSGGTTFFTPSFEAADVYAKGKGVLEMTHEPGRVYRVYSAYKNPKIVNYDGASYTGEGYSGILDDFIFENVPINNKGYQYFNSEVPFPFSYEPREWHEVMTAEGPTRARLSDIKFVPHKVAGSTSQEAAKGINEGYDAVILKGVDEGIGPQNAKIGPIDDYAIRDTRLIKSADAVTFDDKGVRIPLGERDNFSINDIRYGLIPFGIGLTGYGLYNSGK